MLQYMSLLQYLGAFVVVDCPHHVGGRENKMIPNKKQLLVINFIAYHVRMLVLEKISRYFCATTIFLAGISKKFKNKK